MDLNFIHDETDLSVGLSVTCSTTTDGCYSADGLLSSQHPTASPSLFFMQYSGENTISDIESVVHSHEIRLNNLIGDQGDRIMEGNNIQHDVHNIINLDNDEELNNYAYKHNLFLCKNNTPYKSARRLHPDAHKMQVCKVCGKTFKFQTSLLRHNNKFHIYRYQCTACCRVFSRQSYLDVHTSKPGNSCYIEHKVKSKKRR